MLEKIMDNGKILSSSTAMRNFRHRASNRWRYRWAGEFK